MQERILKWVSFSDTLYGLLRSPSRNAPLHITARKPPHSGSWMRASHLKSTKNIANLKKEKILSYNSENNCMGLYAKPHCKVLPDHSREGNLNFFKQQKNFIYGT